MDNFSKDIMSLIVARLEGEEVCNREYRKYIEKLVLDGIGGFVIFGGSYEDVREYLAFLQSLSETPLIIASDIERGVGQQIKGATLIPSQMAIRAGFDIKNERAELESLYSVVSLEALNLGINLAFVPVLDVNTEPDNPIICTRAFSDEPEVVSEYGSFVIKTLEVRGLKTCGKHFPGHGSTRLDSHTALPLLNGDIDEHIIPFRKAIQAGVSSIMAGHLLVSKLDDKPASISESVLNNLLREKLSFRGVVFTDAMNMKALDRYEHAETLSLKAGADIILHPEDPYKSFENISFACKKGLISHERIKQALERVSLLRKNLICLGQKFEKAFSTDFKEFSPLEAFKKTFTMVKNELGDLRRHRIKPYLAGFYDSSAKDLFFNNFGGVYDLLKFKDSEQIPLIAIFTNIRGGGKEFDIGEQERSLIKKIASTRDAIVVSFGNPYVIRFFKEAKTIILAYDSHEIAVAAFLELFNEGLKAKGSLPVKIPWND